MDLELYSDLELTPQNWLHFGAHMVMKALDGSSWKNV